MVGKAIATKADLISPVSGRIILLETSRFQSVTEGDVLAVIEPIGVKTQLDSLKLEIDIIRSRIDPIAEKKRNAVSYFRLRLEWLQQRVSLASSKVNLQRAENELTRDKKLFDQELISADRYDQSLKNVDALKAAVAEATNMVNELGTALDGLQTLDALNQTDQLDEQLKMAIQAQEEHFRRIEQISKPYTLVAPISGKVSSIDRVRGETVMNGDRVLAITSEEPTQLIAYLKAPVAIPLESGTPVRLQTRGKNKRTATSQIEGISPAWEPLSQSADTPNAGEFSLNLGLPILLTIPSDLKIRPGELVDIFLPSP